MAAKDVIFGGKAPRTRGRGVMNILANAVKGDPGAPKGLA
jgi:hypothetical protein